MIFLSSIDLDSIASSIAYAWIQSEVHKRPAVPLLQMQRSDLLLRAENLHAFKLAGLSDSQSELLTLSELSQFTPFPSTTFALVDHNRLGAAYTTDNPNAEVVAVIDHHADEGLYPTANPRIIAPAGSASSHLAALLPAPDTTPLPAPPELCTLLLCAVLIDTDGLKPGGKALQVDRDAALVFAPNSTFGNSIPPLSALAPIDRPNPDALFEAQAIKDLSRTLEEKKADVSHLGAYDLLRRDYKEYTFNLGWAQGNPSIKVGLSTVPVRLKAWGADGKLEKDNVKWMTERKLSVLGVLTSFRDTTKMGKSGKGKHKREMAWVVLKDPEIAALSASAVQGEKGTVLTTQTLATRLWAGLEADTELSVKKHNKFEPAKGALPADSKIKVYKQGNEKATRKAIAPIVKGVLEGRGAAKEKSGVKEKL